MQLFTHSPVKTVFHKILLEYIFPGNCPVHGINGFHDLSRRILTTVKFQNEVDQIRIFFLCRLIRGLQNSRQQTVIRIQKQRIFPRCGTDADIARLQSAFVFILADHFDPGISGRIFGKDPGRTIRGGIVYRDDFEIGQ